MDIYQISKGINLFVIPKKKFKTVEVNFFIESELDDNYTKTALLPYVLRRGSRKFTNLIEIEKYLEELYGARFRYGLLKKGERQIINFGMSVAHPEFIPDNEDLIGKSVEFIWDIISDPLTHEGAFNDSYVEQEKENLAQKISGLINDKIAYSIEKCFQNMCQGERFGKLIYGDKDELKSIDSKSLFEHYRNLMDSNPIYIFIVGDVLPAEVYDTVKRIIRVERKSIKIIPDEISKKLVQEPKYINEVLDVNQGKLCLGYRTNISLKDNNYPALVLYNSILGGGPHSKLFLNVREKASLAYYTFSRIEKFKGLMIIGSGIEVDNYQKALELINEQVEHMGQGNITFEEIDAAKKSLINSYKSIKDDAAQLTDYYFSNHLKNVQCTLDDAIEKIEKISLNEIVKVASSIKQDTIYFLTNKGREGE